MKLIRLIALSMALSFPAFAAYAQGKPAPKDAVLYFVWPHQGSVIKGGFWCRFGLRNMGVTHAGDNYPNSGHHHLLIDVESRSIRTNRFRKTNHIFISARARPKLASSFHRARIRSSLCSAMPTTIRSSLR